MGLASNFVGLFLFHGAPFPFDLLSVAHLHPEHSHDHGHDNGKGSATSSSTTSAAPSVREAHTPRAASPTPHKHKTRPRSDSYSSLYGHPAATRASMVQAAQEIAQARSPSPVAAHRKSFSKGRSRSRQPTHDETVFDDEPTDSPGTYSREEPTATNGDERTPLLRDPSPSSTSLESGSPQVTPGHLGGHGSMNMRALLLHVFGDALGNVGVIATGLVIWKTSWAFKYYFDPMISLVITIIIFSSALPLGACLFGSHDPIYTQC